MTVRKSIFDSSLLYIIITAFTVIAILCGFIFKIYVNQFERIIYRLESEAARIDRTFVDTFDVTAELMKMLISQILSNHQDHAYIERIISRYSSNLNIFNALTWTVFSWTNEEDKIIIDGIYGIIDKPIDISGRSYIKNARKTPNKFVLGDVGLGATSRLRMIPAAIGITDYNNNYIGTITVGFDLAKFATKLLSVTKSEDIKFIIFNKNNELVYSFPNAKLIVSRMPEIINNSHRFKTQGKIYSKLSSFIKGNNYYITKLSKYPYVICVYFDKSAINQSLWEDITSRIIEISIFGLVSCLLMVYIYRREVFLRKQAQIAQAIAIKASKSKSEFLAYTAHELRTPLGFIVTGSEIMKSQLFGKLSTKYLEYINSIHQSGIELLALISDLLDDMMAEQGKFTIEKEALDVEEMLINVVKRNMAKAHEAGLNIALTIKPNLPKLYSDKRRLTQVLNNLITNAIKYSPTNTEINVIAKLEKNNLLLSVIDQGFGITEKEMEIAFSNFGTIKNENTGHIESVGLGLPLVKMLVTELGADLEVESQKDLGTNMTIIFPPTRIPKTKS